MRERASERSRRSRWSRRDGESEREREKERERERERKRTRERESENQPENRRWEMVDLVRPCGLGEVTFSSSSLLTSNLSKSDQLLTTYRSPLTDNQDLTYRHPKTVSSLELSDTQSLCALNTSPPRNRFTILRSSHFQIENCTERYNRSVTRHSCQSDVGWWVGVQRTLHPEHRSVTRHPGPLFFFITLEPRVQYYRSQ